MLNRLVEEKDIAPHIPVFDRSKRDDGTFSRSDFHYDPTSDVYHCPAGKTLTTTGTLKACVTDTVRRFGGFVAKYLGDGVLIFLVSGRA
jgi:hypothetical protein